jgi:hypothetical protein
MFYRSAAETYESSRARRVESMPKFLIEVPHEAETLACARAVKIFLESGSHFMTHAEWGCKDGEHKAWLFADVDNKDQARAMLPPRLLSSCQGRAA